MYLRFSFLHQIAKACEKFVNCERIFLYELCVSSVLQIVTHGCTVCHKLLCMSVQSQKGPRAHVHILSIDIFCELAPENTMQPVFL